MPEDPAIYEILEEILESGRAPEEVCSADPILLAEVRRRLTHLQKVDAQIDDLFASVDAVSSRAERTHLGQLNGKMPEIPGYEVESILGHGGMGVVYRATHLKLNRTVAIKMLLAGVYAGAIERKRFLGEAEAIARLSHPNVVQVFDMGESNGFPYFTMEYVEGGSLARKLNGSPWPVDRTARTIRTLALAVQCAHEAGVIHRDLKPGNILLGSDGTLKISDFGLARRVDDDANVTMTGARVGTPTYMAPEQALAQTNNIGPATDIYALGVILYELLTGRPPFRGESSADTVQQVIADDAIPPSRLNAYVPRDLEMICLTCLRKEPHRRYVSAAELAEDLGRFLRGECVAARPVSRTERTVKWIRRRPGLAACLVFGTILALAMVSSALWWISQRAATARAVEQDLQEVSALNAESRWPEAEAALERATGRLGNQGPAALRARVEQARRNADLVNRLETIRANRAIFASAANPQYSQAMSDYGIIFRETQIGTLKDDPNTVAAKISASDIRPALVAALYDWLDIGGNGRESVWLLEILRRVDPDPTGWRDRALDPQNWRDDAKAAALLSNPALSRQSVETLLVVRTRIASFRDATPFLETVQVAHPDNYWANLALALALQNEQDYEGSIRYSQAMIAPRPSGALPYFLVGAALSKLNRFDDAAAEFREAIRLEPNVAAYRGALGVVLAHSGHYDEAIREIDESFPQLATSQDDLSALVDSLASLGRFDDIAQRYRHSFEGDWLPIWWQAKLRNALVHAGRLDEVLAIWKTTLNSREQDCAGYAEYCLFMGRDREYRDACRILLDRYEKSNDPRVCEHVSRTCLLAAPSERDLQPATAMIDRALASEQAHRTFLYPCYRVVKGMAEYRAGHYQAAIEIMEGDAAPALGPIPQLIAAMAHWRMGEKPQARQSLAQAEMSYDWSAPYAEITDRWQYRVPRRERATDSEVAEVWMYHVLRREAEAMILPDLPAFFEGRYEPKEVNERLAMTGECDFRGYYAAHARLWESALRDNASLAAPDRKWAVRAAVLAGCGEGEDARTLSADDRAAFRDLARQWIRAEVDSLTARLKAPGTSDAGVAQSKDTLRAWSTTWPELSPVHDPMALSKLPTEEEAKWAALWRDVTTATQNADRYLYH